MTFQPYTFRQLQEIVLSRIRGIDAFEEDALELVSRKVSCLFIYVSFFSYSPHIEAGVHLSHVLISIDVMLTCKKRRTSSVII